MARYALGDDAHVNFGDGIITDPIFERTLEPEQESFLVSVGAIRRLEDAVVESVAIDEAPAAPADEAPTDDAPRRRRRPSTADEPVSQ